MDGPLADTRGIAGNRFPFLIRDATPIRFVLENTLKILES